MKIARLKGYAPIWIVGSRSDGLGFKGAESNRGRRFSIERLRAITATAAAGIAGGLFLAAVRGEKSHRSSGIRRSRAGLDRFFGR